MAAEAKADIFRFKQFSIDQAGCAMKINTDGVLLAALVDKPRATNILDIGTGTGVIALMLAQRQPLASIDAVEVEKVAAATAEKNFRQTSFADRLSIYALSFQDFFDQYPNKKYDLIVSNPPFYTRSLSSPSAQKNLAKHSDHVFFVQLISGSAGHLQPEGQIWLILPPDSAVIFKELSASHGLSVSRIIYVKSYPHSEPHREILALSFNKTTSAPAFFVIYDEPKKYSIMYQTALTNFFTIF